MACFSAIVPANGGNLDADKLCLINSSSKSLILKLIILLLVLDGLFFDIDEVVDIVDSFENSLLFIFYNCNNKTK